MAVSTQYVFETELVNFINTEILEPDILDLKINSFVSSDNRPLHIYKVTHTSPAVLDMTLVFDYDGTNATLLGKGGLSGLKAATGLSGLVLTEDLEGWYESSAGGATQSLKDYLDGLSALSNTSVIYAVSDSSSSLEVLDISPATRPAAPNRDFKDTDNVYLIFDTENGTLFTTGNDFELSDISSLTADDMRTKLKDWYRSSDDINAEVQEFWDYTGLTVTGNTAKNAWSGVNSTDTITIDVTSISYGGSQILGPTTFVIVFDKDGVVQSHTGLDTLATATMNTVTVENFVAGFNNWYPQTFFGVAPGITVTIPPGAPDPLTLDENNDTGTYTIVLDTEPDYVVTITPTSSNIDALTVSSALTFTTANWATPQTVTIKGVDDANDVNESVTLSHVVLSTDTDYDAKVMADIVVTMIDDDVSTGTPGITQSATTATVAEDGKVTYTIVLDTQPTADVTIAPTSNDLSAAKVSTLSGPGAPLIFNTTNWATPQTVTIEGVEDANDVNESVTVSHVVTSTDTNYSTKVVTDIAVTMTDNDTGGGTPGVTQSATTATVDENGVVTYTIVLDDEPTADVIITPTSSMTSAATVSAALTFTTANWASPQTVTITGVDDANDLDEYPVITHVASSTDTDYAGISIGTVSVTVADDDYDAEHNLILEGVKGFLDQLGLTSIDNLTAALDSNDTSDIDTVTIKADSFIYKTITDTTGLNLSLEFEHGVLVTKNSTGLDVSNVVAITGFDENNINTWYSYVDPDTGDEYALLAVNALLQQVDIVATNLNAVSLGIENGEIITFTADTMVSNGSGQTYTNNNISIEFINGKVSGDPTGISNFSSEFTTTNLEIWYQYSGPEQQKIIDQQDDGYVDDDHVETYSQVWTWEEWIGDVKILWTVVDADVNGVWTSTETGSNGDVRVHKNSWDNSSQANTNTSTFTSGLKDENGDPLQAYTRTEVSDSSGAKITYTGTMDHIGWQNLDGIYTNVNVVETLDPYWMTTNFTGTGTNKDSETITFVWNASTWSLDATKVVGGATVAVSIVSDVFDDHFKSGETNEYSWTEWDNTIWKVSEQDVGGVWTTTETHYKEDGTTPTGDVRIFTSSWDNTTQISIWSEEFTDGGNLNYKRVEESGPSGTTVVTTGSSDQIGWMYLGGVYTELNVTETMDMNWNTTDISGTGKNTDGNTVPFTWDSGNWELLVDGASLIDHNNLDDYWAGGDSTYVQEDWSNSWEWQDGQGVTWTVVDEQVGDKWTSTETGSNGDVRIMSSDWSENTSTWSESFKSASKGVDFTMQETYLQDGTSMSVTIGTTDHIGWIPLDGIYTNVDVTEARDNTWHTSSIDGTGIDPNGKTVKFDKTTDDEFGNWQLTIDGVAYDPWGDFNVSKDQSTGDQTFEVEAYTNTFTWQDGQGVDWTVVDEEKDGVWTSTETGSNGDQRINTSTWDNAAQTSTWKEEYKSGDSIVHFTRLEVFDEKNGTSSTQTTGISDHVGWEYLGEIFTAMDVTETRDSSWNTLSIVGTAVNTDGYTVTFGYEDNQVTIDGDVIGSQGHEDIAASGDNYDFTWSYFDGMGIEWTVVDKQDGEWWKSTETGSNGDTRMNKYKWDNDNDGKGDYNKFVSKYKSADETIKYKMVEKFYEDYKDLGETRSVLTYKGSSDHLGWDYIGQIYTDIDFRIVRDDNWNIVEVTTNKKDGNGDLLKDGFGNKLPATAKDGDGNAVEITSPYGQILIDGRDIYNLNNDFFDYNDGDKFDAGTGVYNEFDMHDDGSGNDIWEFDSYNEFGEAVSIVEKDIAGVWTTIETNNNTLAITTRAFSYDSGTGKEIETEISYKNKSDYENNVIDNSKTSSFTFIDNADGGFTMSKSVTSTLNENYTQTETQNADGTITIKTHGNIMYGAGNDEMLVKDVEITQVLDRNWNTVEYFGTTEIPDEFLTPLRQIGITADNSKVLITFDGVMDQYGEPLLTFTMINTDTDKVLINPLTSEEMIMTSSEVHEEDTLSGYELEQGVDYSTSRKSWTWVEDSFNVDNSNKAEIKTTFTGKRSDDSAQTITVVETLKLILNDDLTVKNIDTINHQITTSKGEDYTIDIITTAANVQITYAGVKQYLGVTYNDVDVVKIVNQHLGVSIDGTARSLDGSSVQIFKPMDSNKLEIVAVGRDGKEQKITEELVTANLGYDEFIPQEINDFYQWNYTDHNNVTWTVTDKYDGTTFSSIETSSAGDRSFTDTWAEDGTGSSVFIETLTGQAIYKEERVFTSLDDHTNNSFKDIATVTTTRGGTPIEQYTETMVFDTTDYSSTRTIATIGDGQYEFEGVLYKSVSITDAKDVNWQTTSVTGSATRVSDDAVVTISSTGTNNAYGDPILTFTINGVITTETDNSNANPVADDDAFTIVEDASTTFDVLADDTDAEDDISIKSIGDADHGEVYLVDGKVVYTPDTNYHGADSFTYTVTDGRGGTDTATVDVTVTSLNEAVTGVDDAFTVAENSLVTTFNLLTNDTDIDGDDPIVDTLDTSATKGTVTFDNGVVSYKPLADFSGVDTFTYKVIDGNGAEDTATVSITVEATNVAPVAVADTKTLTEDESVQLDVLSNDTDDSDTTLTIDSVGDPLHGTVKLVSGYLFYTPDADYSGSDTVEYVAMDSDGAKTTGTVTLTIDSRNDAPTAVNDVITLAQDSDALTVDVLGNDSDAEGDTVTVTGVSEATNGTVVFADGKVTYTPTAGYSGADTFTYSTTDGTNTNTATVSVTVAETNLDPITVADTKVITEDATSAKISVLDNDTDPNNNTLTLDSVSAALHGTVSIANGKAVYVPDANYSGTDTFTYITGDGQGSTTTGSVTVTINAVNDAPKAVADSLGTIATNKGPVKLDVLANDYDIDTGDTFSIKSVGSDGSQTATTALGNKVSVSSGKITYTNSANKTSGTDSFDYTIVDASGGTSTATATLSISTNKNPDALNDKATVLEDSSSTEIEVLLNDTDVNGDRVQVLNELQTDPLHGSVTITNGKLFYTPTANYTGEDSFVYIVKDGKLGRDEAKVSITVTGVNDAPKANTDIVSIEVGSSAQVINLLGNDTDADADTLTVTGVEDALKGTVTLANGVVTYTPIKPSDSSALTAGTDSFSYTVSDGTTTSTGSASITINDVNNAPVAVADTVTTSIKEDSKMNTIDVLTNDTDADDGDKALLSVVSVTQPDHGKVILISGKISYTPTADYYGSDTFSYTVEDPSGDTSNAIVTLTVENVNDNPTAVDDDLGNVSLGARKVKLDLVSNDTDADGDAIVVTSSKDPKYGSITLSNDGVAYYTPGTELGNDTFVYTITGGDTATAKINVVAANNAPGGAVTISGAAQTGREISASNTLTDADKMLNATVTYQWYEDGTAIDGETGTSYKIPLESVGATYVVKASYTDDKGNAETVSSDATSQVTKLDTPFTFSATSITGTAANDITALAGYDFAATDELIKLTLKVDLDDIHSRTDIESITAADLNLTFDWTKYDALSSSSTGKFVMDKTGGNLIALTSSSTSDSDTFDQLVLASTRASEPLITMADTDATSVVLLDVYVKPAASAGTLAVELNGVIEANQGQITFSQHDSTTSNITEAENTLPTGSVSVKGTVAVDETLTVTHTLADVDGIGVVAYQWLRDGVNISGETNSTYKITTSDINKDLSVKASYTDDGGEAESSTSTTQTVTQSTADKPIMITSKLVTAKEASIEAYGSDYSSDPSEVYVRLTFEADMARFVDTSIDSIAAFEFDFNLDWTKFENLTYTGGVEKLFDVYENYQGSMTKGVVTDKNSGEITKVVVASMNLANKPVLSLVDDVDYVAGDAIKVDSKEDLVTIYLNPKDTVKDFEITYGGIVSVDQGASEFTQLSHQLEVEAKTYDALVSTGASSTKIDMLKGVSMSLWTGESTIVDTGSSVTVDSGEISIDSTVAFNAVKLSAGAYNFDDAINVSDAVAVLRHIVGLDILESTSYAFHAADVNNNDKVNVTDAVAVLRDIVGLESIDTFDLIDDKGARVTQLDANSTGAAPTWTLVANGDVTGTTGKFDDAYFVSVDIT